MFLNDFVNRNNRCVEAQEYAPNDAPQRYYKKVDQSCNHANVQLSSLSVGSTFLFEAYPKAYPGKWYRYEMDSLSEDGFICPWVSDTGRFLINSEEETLCFSLIPRFTRVFICKGHTDEMRASFSGSDDLSDSHSDNENSKRPTEPPTNDLRASWGSLPSTELSLRSDDLMSWASSSSKVIDHLMDKVAEQDKKLDAIQNQLTVLIDLMNYKTP